MNRRHFTVSGLACLAAKPVFAAEQGWQARLIQGGFDGKEFLAGLHIMLMPGWKTYWRVPGEAGIPPQIKVEGAMILESQIDAPIPTRFSDENGESIGYHDAVVFPFRVQPKTLALPAAIHLSSFFGVCEKICKPAKFELDAILTKEVPAAAEASLLARWRELVPVRGEFVWSAIRTDSFNEKDSTQKVRFAMVGRKVDDFFVESESGYYFRKPEFSSPVLASCIVDGLPGAGGLKNEKIKVTAIVDGKPVEQSLMVS